MQYTEEHYAEMYNNLPEGLKDLVLSGRLAILVSAIGSRHGLSADQIADLEPAIEDVCLGLITKDELVENIKKSTDVDTRVANRIAAEAELEILKPFDAELVIARHQKEELDQKIVGGDMKTVHTLPKNPIPMVSVPTHQDTGPKNVSEHAVIKKVGDWYNKDGQNFGEEKKAPQTNVTNFDWDKDFGKKEVSSEKENTVEMTNPATSTSPAENNNTTPVGSLENKINELTESIKLINSRFGLNENGAKPEKGMSPEMEVLMKRLEKAEKENEENKRLIKSLQGVKPVETIFGGEVIKSETKIPIDKERKVEIAHTETEIKKEIPNGNIQITSVSKQIPIEKVADTPKIVGDQVVTSTVSKDTLDSIVETRNKVTPTVSNIVSEKKSLSLSELIAQGDKKIKDAVVDAPQKTKTLIFPGLNDEKKIDIKNMNDRDAMRSTLLNDLDFLKQNPSNLEANKLEKQEETAVVKDTPVETINSLSEKMSTKTYESNPFKEELIPKTKDERMRILQEKIKGLNKGISVGGKTNLSGSGLDPYRL